MASSDSKLRAHEVKTSSYTDSEREKNVLQVTVIPIAMDCSILELHRFTWRSQNKLHGLCCQPGDQALFSSLARALDKLLS